MKQLIEQSRQTIAVAVNAEMSMLYWQIGKRISQEVLNFNRAEYGKQVVVMLSKQLTEACASWNIGVSGRSMTGYNQNSTNAQPL